MPTFHVRGTIEVPFECEVTASGYREAVAYVKTRSVADVFDEHVGSFDFAEVVVNSSKKVNE